MVYWDKFGKPPILTKDGPLISAWWHDGLRAAALERAAEDDTSLTLTAHEDTTDVDDTANGVNSSDSKRKPPSVVLLIFLAGVIVAIAWMAHASLIRQTPYTQDRS